MSDETTPAAPAATAKEKREQNRWTYDHQNGAVIRDGWTYPLGGLSEADRQYVGLLGLALWLSRHDNPREAYENAKSGVKPARGKASEDDQWREAAAIFHAEHTLKQSGFKAGPGKKLRDTAEFQAGLSQARQITAAWTKEKLAQARAHPEILREHRALTGKGDDLSALFAPAAETSAPAELDQAA